MPPKSRVSREDILQAAFNIVDKDGMRSFTARNVAKEMGLSTRPVYFYFSSMEELQKEVMNKARDLLLKYATTSHTDRVFLNMGTGLALFARDHKQLFRLLFLESNEFKDLIDGFLLSLREEMKEDSWFTTMAQEERDVLLNKMWIFTHGLASLICVRLIDKDSEKYIINMLDQVGNVVIADAMNKILKK